MQNFSLFVVYNIKFRKVHDVGFIMGISINILVYPGSNLLLFSTSTRKLKHLSS